MQNYKVYYLTSNISLLNSTDAFVSGDMALGDMELIESQKGLNVGEVKTLRIRMSFTLNKAQCDYMTDMCLLILSHDNASYTEENLEDNIICINVSSSKVCSPGMDILL